MNAPFKHALIENILAEACVSISGLKANPAAVVAEAQNRQVAILNRNRPVAYMVSPRVWSAMLDLIEDHEDCKLVEARQGELDDAVPVKLEDLV